jgi:hypothetical protein
MLLGCRTNFEAVWAFTKRQEMFPFCDESNVNNVVRFDNGTKLKRCTECFGTSHHPVRKCTTGSGSKNATNYENLVQTHTFLGCKRHRYMGAMCLHAIVQNKHIYALEALRLIYPSRVKEDRCFPPPWASIRFRTGARFC